MSIGSYVSSVYLLGWTPDSSRTGLILVFLCGLYATSSDAQVANCDCRQQIGTCAASIDFDKARGLAEISASANTCAHVEFWVDGTPYSTLFDGGRTVENIMILDKRRAVEASIKSCGICKATGTTAGAQDNLDVDADPMRGDWALKDWTIHLADGDVVSDGIKIGSYRGTSGSYRLDFGPNNYLTCDFSVVSGTQISRRCVIQNSDGTTGTVSPPNLTRVN